MVTSARQALDLCARLPGTRTLAPNPKKKWLGWSSWIAELRDVPASRMVRDRHVVVELEQDASIETKAIVRQIGALLYAQGALEVRCHGRVIQRPSEQRTLFGGQR